MAIEFLYFDLGKVLVDFDPGQMCRQMASVAGIAPELVAKAVFDDELQRRFELGQIDLRQYYREFCRRTDTRAPYHELARAATEIFELNLRILPIVASLVQTRRRLGILSNTCSAHWQHCATRYCLVRECFSRSILSFEIGSMKPDREVFRIAAEQAGFSPEEIFFVDDVAANVEGARCAGLDAVHYESARQLADALRRRGVPLDC